VALDAADRSVLHARIAQRFDAMLAAGFLDEMRMLRERYTLDPAMPSMRSVGYRQAWDYLDGATDATTFRDQAIAATRQLAKRQLTWQRKLLEQWPELHRIDCLHPALHEVLAKDVMARLEARP
jgi:tRNA dimethylallyltransferase